MPFAANERLKINGFTTLPSEKGEKKSRINHYLPFSEMNSTRKNFLGIYYDT